MTKPLVRSTLVFAAMSSLMILAACGGGSDESSNGPGTHDPSPSPSPSPATPPTDSSANCPSSGVSAMWFDQRLGCLKVGTKVINVSAGATGATSDYGFVINQRVLDGSFTNVLGLDVARHFSRILCVRNAPSGLTDYSFRLSLATDMVVLLRSSGTLPTGYSTFTGATGGARPSFVQETCDSKTHPIIIDYATGAIESINPDAMSSVAVYDLTV